MHWKYNSEFISLKNVKNYQFSVWNDIKMWMKMKYLYNLIINKNAIIDRQIHNLYRINYKQVRSTFSNSTLIIDCANNKTSLYGIFIEYNRGPTNNRTSLYCTKTQYNQLYYFIVL